MLIAMCNFEELWVFMLQTLHLWYEILISTEYNYAQQKKLYKNYIKKVCVYIHLHTYTHKNVKCKLTVLNKKYQVIFKELFFAVHWKTTKIYVQQSPKSSPSF